MIQFYYQGRVCRETLSVEATKSNINYANRLRGEIINAIERDKFDYAHFFPHSKHARYLGHVAERIKIKKLLDNYLALVKEQMEHSTYKCIVKNCKTHLYPTFGHVDIQDLKAVHIRDWIKKLTCKKKTINNILTPLRAIIEQSLVDDYIHHNPMHKVVITKIIKKEATKSDFVVDPFDKKEINLILEKAEGQIKNLYQFAFFTGLRPSELIGLRWSDVDWAHGCVRVEETIVDKQTKGPKTVAGYRDVSLLPPALKALRDQKQFTFLENGRVFHNPATRRPWETSQQLRRTAWTPLLRRAGVRYRNPYQTRHTYASMMISKGELLMWLSQQMGHADAQVTLKRYARWMPDANAKGGYQTRHNWDAYLEEQDSKSEEEQILVLANIPKKVA